MTTLPSLLRSGWIRALLYHRPTDMAKSVNCTVSIRLVAYSATCIPSRTRMTHRAWLSPEGRPSAESRPMTYRSRGVGSSQTKMVVQVLPDHEPVGHTGGCALGEPLAVLQQDVGVKHRPAQHKVATVNTGLNFFG